MVWRRIATISLACVIGLLCVGRIAAATEYRGQVLLGVVPVPGATVTATHGTHKFTATTDEQGWYSFPDLIDGEWAIQIEMLCFATIQQDVVITSNVPTAHWELKLLPLDAIRSQIKPQPSPAITANTATVESKPAKTAETAKPQEETDQRASDGLLINGSTNNAATSQFSLDQAFGNRRNSRNGLYNAGIGFILDNSALDARPYSLSGLSIPKAAYNQMTGIATFGGPLKIPHLLPRGPNFFVIYQWLRNRNATTDSALVPDAAERNGDFSNVLDSTGQPIRIFDPATGLPFAGDVVPISPQAPALLQLYPLPNIADNSRYNYQIPILNSTHQDALQSRLDKTIGPKDQLYGGFALQSTRNANSNLFGFLDATDVLGVNANINWAHRLNHALFMTAGYRFSRLRTQVKPYFEKRENVSGTAGITGNDQDPTDWGPPELDFSSGFASLTESESAFNRNQTNAVSYSMSWNRPHQAITFGGDFRRQQFNYLSQQNPRGVFTFTGAATQGVINRAAAGGSDFADFLLGIPDTSALAYGNADKYLRESVYDAYAIDDWRIRPELSVNAGLRWEYGAPITELFGRLVNLDITDGFAAAAPVVANDPVGSLTGQHYPSSLIPPDKRGIEPRIGISWRPFSGLSIVVRAGYGIYADTSVYQATALQLAQQEPLSKSLSVQNSAACPLTLASGFNNCSSITADTFAVDPNFRVGYAQNWQLAVQSDLPFALQLTATYLGIKGTHGVQEFLPNTYPTGASNPCSACPSGFTYRASNGNSTRQAASLQLRRRLKSGFTATTQYTFSKSIDDDCVLGGQGSVAVSGNSQSDSAQAPQTAAVIAQNWLDLKAERGLSTFDRRHLLNLQIQYTTGMGLNGGTLLSGWRGTALKEWTFLSNITASSGLPESPIYLAAVEGTGVTGSIRADVTGAPVYKAPSGLFLNPAAYTAPQAGHWGNAGRDSITGPSQFSLNASLARTFRVRSRFNLDVRLDSTNVLNHGVFTAWNTTVNSSQFGLAAAVNLMRSIQTTLRLRY